MPLLDLIFSMFLFFIWVAWIWLVISVFIDIVRSDDLSGWGKAGWTFVVLLLPWLGVLIYLISRGDSMHRRQADEFARRQQVQEQYIRTVAGGGGASSADELAKLGELREQGVLTEAEFNDQKAKILARA